MDKKQLEKIVNIAIPVLAVLLIAESVYAVISLSGRKVEPRKQSEVVELQSAPVLVAMKMTTEPAQLEVGEEFVLWVKADLLKDYEISGSDVFVGFDIEGFEVVEETGVEEAVLTEGISLPKVLRNIVDKEEGQVVVSVVADGGVSLKAGTMVDLVGIKFKAIESGNYDFRLTKKGEESKAGSTFVGKDASEIEFTVESLPVTVI